MKQNFAFISYNHKDVKHAQWLQKKLENYKLPTEIHNEYEDSRFIRPVFRDQTDLNTGVLANTLRENLEASKYLIVLCSPNSAKSEWVSNEVKTFIEWGRLDDIIPLIVDGQPNCYNPDLECFPKYLKEYTAAHPEAELLGISFAEVGKEKAFIRVVSKMLDVSFDTLWKRHERERRRRIALRSIGVTLLLLLTYWLAMPYQLTLRLHDPQPYLPQPQSADGVMCTVNVDGTDYAVTDLDEPLVIGGLSGIHRMLPIPVSITAKYYFDSLSVAPVLGAGLSQTVDIDLQRDATFASFGGQVLDASTMLPIADASFACGEELQYQTTTDAEGRFNTPIPTDDQRMTLPVRITAEGYADYESEEETVDQQCVFIMQRK